MSPMDDDLERKRRYRIQTVARMTGLATPLLRAWERRYRLVTPQRGPSGYREYSDEDVMVLQRARRLMERGYTIGEVARLGREALLAATSEEALLPARPKGADASLSHLVEQFVRAVDKGDVPAAEQAVARALHGPDLHSALHDFVTPALFAVCEGREVPPGVVLVATQVLRGPLLGLLGSANIGLGPVYAVTATLPGEQHDLGALVAALQMSRAGHRSLHLGPGITPEELAAVAQLTHARLVALSFATVVEPAELDRRLASLQPLVTAGINVAVGGRALDGRQAELRARGLHYADDPRALAALETS